MNAPRSLRRRAALTATVAAAALALTACGDDGGSGGTSTSPGTAAAAAATTTPEAATGRHNRADVTFAQGMIPHHRQAVAMSAMAASHGASTEVKTLAENIKKAQDPEIETMSGWLRSWGEKVPEGMTTDNGMGHGTDGTPMPGMMGDQRLDELDRKSGKAFDTMFLTMMIEHHKGAITMAETEKKDGAYDPAKQLADQIITTQTAEITKMEQMLGKS
ncbi:DUF305 domain-containing protein [Streptomyces sp. NPDC029216]|uniref:DUF305 domain-containing protein n=1 Tax=Streptomyces sp. NPDC029216 TaxID=3154701 RepID=UPI00340C3EDD